MLRAMLRACACLTALGHGFVENADDLDEVPWPQLRMQRQALRHRHAPIERDVVRPQLHRRTLAPGAECQHQVAADVIHGIDDEAQILQRGARRIRNGRAALASLGQRDDADELAAEAVQVSAGGSKFDEMA